MALYEGSIYTLIDGDQLLVQRLVVCLLKGLMSFRPCLLLTLFITSDLAAFVWQAQFVI